MPFDEGSGQVFEETLVRAPRRRKPLLGCRGVPPPAAPHPRGARRLSGIALRHILCNLDDLTVEMLRCLDLLTLERLWESVAKAELDTVARWTSFAKTGRFGRHHAKRLRVRVRNGKACGPQLAEVTRLCTSPSLQWFTSLDLGPFDFSIADLMTLTGIPNLQSLALCVDEDRWCFSIDLIIRAWAREASANGGFSQLQMLFLDLQQSADHPDHRAVAGYLDAFPVLDTFCLKTYRRGALAPSETRAYTGWLVNQDTKVWEFADALGSWNWEHLFASYVQYRRGLRLDETTAKPFISASLVNSDTTYRTEGRKSQNRWLALEHDTKEHPKSVETHQSHAPPSKKLKVRDGKWVTGSCLFS